MVLVNSNHFIADEGERLNEEEHALDDEQLPESEQDDFNHDLTNCHFDAEMSTASLLTSLKSKYPVAGKHCNEIAVDVLQLALGIFERGEDVKHQLSQCIQTANSSFIQDKLTAFNIPAFRVDEDGQQVAVKDISLGLVENNNSTHPHFFFVPIIGQLKALFEVNDIWQAVLADKSCK